MSHKQPSIDLDALNPPGQTYPDDAWDLLSPRLTAARRAKLERIAARRTHYIRLVAQDVHDPHNISACLRSAEGFGVQHVDIITPPGKFRASEAARGVASWLDIHRHHDISSCATKLKAEGYRLATAYPAASATTLWELPLDRPLAVIFGNEHAGLDPQWLECTDLSFTIPMAGFVESLNISVCAAVSLAHLTRTAAMLQAGRYYLSQGEAKALLNAWACKETRDYQSQLARLRAEHAGPRA